MGFVLSFTKFKVITDAHFIGLKNYIRAFTLNNEFIHALSFTTLFTIVSMITVNVFAFILALLLTNGLKGTSFFRSVFFMPNLIGGIVLGYIWNLLINGVLLHYFGEDISFKAKYGFWGLIILMCWQQIGYMMIIYIAGLQSVPEDMLEAAKIDGATKTQTLFRVTIPNVMPSITICTFLSLTNGFKLYDQNLVLTNGAPVRRGVGMTEMLALNIANNFTTANQRGVAQAKAVLFFILVTTIALVQLRLTRSKEVQQ